jgi:Zn-dependent protease
LWGLGASLFAFAVHLVSVAPVWAAIAHTSAWLNLFNLLPLGPLDGGRGFRALSRGQRWLAAASLGVGYLVTGDGLALLLAIVAAFRALTGAAPARGDGRALSKYALLALALAGLCRLSASSASPV